MSPVKVLVVDDELDQVTSITNQLKDLQFLVVGKARNAHEAVKLTQEERPDLVIMDIQMPGLNGIKAAEVIWRLYGTPVMFVTGYGEGERENSLKAGAFGYFPKGMQIQTLKTAIDAALYNHETFNVQIEEYGLALLGIDPSLRLLSLSESAENLTGYSRSELMGRRLEELLAPESISLFNNSVKRTMEMRGAGHAKIDLVSKSGQKIPVDVDLSRVGLNGDTMGIRLTLWDKSSLLAGVWPERNRRRLGLIEKKYREGLNDAEARDLEELQVTADSYVESLGEVDQCRLNELRVIYEGLLQKGHERGEA